MNKNTDSYLLLRSLRVIYVCLVTAGCFGVAPHEEGGVRVCGDAVLRYFGTVLR